jgi:predicted protein tyrosine phosphatase
MISQILVYSRKQIEICISTSSRPVEDRWALISIWSSKELVDVFLQDYLSKIGCLEALSIKFADLTLEELERIEHKKEFKIFDEDNAKEIIAFIDKINLLDIPVLIVHCAAGISRSSAVGLFACRYLKLNEQTFRDLHKHILPNLYVLNTLSEVSGMNKDYIASWQSKENTALRERMMKRIYS